MTSLPPDLARDVATVRKALHSPQAGPDVLAAREALDRVEKALTVARERAEAWQTKGVRFEQLQRSVLALGQAARTHLSTRHDDTETALMDAVYDAEERAT